MVSQVCQTITGGERVTIFGGSSVSSEDVALKLGGGGWILCQLAVNWCSELMRISTSLAQAWNVPSCGVRQGSLCSDNAQPCGAALPSFGLWHEFASLNSPRNIPIV